MSFGLVSDFPLFPDSNLVGWHVAKAYIRTKHTSIRSSERGEVTYIGCLQGVGTMDAEGLVVLIEFKRGLFENNRGQPPAILMIDDCAFVVMQGAQRQAIADDVQSSHVLTQSDQCLPIRRDVWCS